MKNNTTRVRLLSFLVGCCSLALAGITCADPSGRVARLSYVSGPVSFSPAGEDQWVDAGVNRPLTTGDRLWTDQGARAELQIGSAVVRAGAETSINLLNLDDSVAQFQLAQGTVTVRVRRLAPDATFEIDTPNLAFSIKQPGEYRIDVDLNGDATAVAVRTGSAEVYGEGAAYVIGQGQWYRFTGIGLAQYDSAGLPPPDDYDRWCFERDRRAATAIAAQYVSPEVIGYEDLDEYGSWGAVAGYGNVWTPARVSVGWSPYHYGHWAWIDPWGWTWIDDAPWGFAPFHYGRWAYIGSRWGWIPGPIAVRPVYAPALVAFIGGSDFRLTMAAGGIAAGIGWFPLGPHEVYQPAYTVSRNYFTNINVSNTTVNNTYITNIYNNSNVTQTYANQRVNGAVVAVPTTAFADSRQVAQVAVPVSGEMLARGRVSPVAAVVPAAAAVLGAGAAARFRPSSAVLARPAVARITPPPAPVPFAERQQALRAHPGQPLDAAALATIRPAAQTAGQPKIRVVQPAQAAKPIAAANRPGNAGFGRPPGAGGNTEAAAQKGGPPPGRPIEPNRESMRPQGQGPMQGQGQGQGRPPAENRQDLRPQGQGQAPGQDRGRPPENRQDTRPQGPGQAQGQQQQEQQQLRQQQQQQRQQQQQQLQQKQQQEQPKQQLEQQKQRQEQQRQQQLQQQQQKQQQGQQRQQQEQQKQQQELQRQQQQQRPQAQPADAKPAQPPKAEAKGDPKADAKRDEGKKAPE